MDRRLRLRFTRACFLLLLACGSAAQPLAKKPQPQGPPKGPKGRLNDPDGDEEKRWDGTISGSYDRNFYGDTLRDKSTAVTMAADILTSAFSKSRGIGLYTDRTAFYLLAQSVVLSDPSIFGCSVALETRAARLVADSGPISTNGFAAYVYRGLGNTDSDSEHSGIYSTEETLDWSLEQFESTLNPSNISKDLAPVYDYRAAEWFIAPVKQAQLTGEGSSYWSPAYFDAGGGGVWMVTFSHTFSFEGAPAGVVTADFEVQAVTYGAYSYPLTVVDTIEVGYVSEVVTVQAATPANTTSIADDAQLYVQVRHSGGHPVRQAGDGYPFVQSRGMGKYAVLWEPPLVFIEEYEEGYPCYAEYKVFVSVEGFQIIGSPFTVRLHPGPLDLFLYNPTADSASTWPSALWKGEAQNATFTARDYYGNVACRGGLHLDLVLEENGPGSKDTGQWGSSVQNFPAYYRGAGVYTVAITAAWNSSDAYLSIKDMSDPWMNGTEGDESLRLQEYNRPEVWCEPGSAGYKDRVAEDAQTCRPCSAGNYSYQWNSRQCFMCAPGSFSPGPQHTDCDLCDFWQYQPLPGQSSCLDCPKHSQWSDLADLMGTALESCKCVRGFFALPGFPQEGACQRCPDRASCEGAFAPPEPDYGYWVNPVCPANSYQCMSNHCNYDGDPNSTEWKERANATDWCRAGHEGRLCFDCVAGRGKRGSAKDDSCYTCQAGLVQALYYLLLVSLNIGAITLTMRFDIDFTKKLYIEKYSSSDSSLAPPIHSQLVKVLCDYFQFNQIVDTIQMQGRSQAVATIWGLLSFGTTTTEGQSSAIVSLDCLFQDWIGAERQFVQLLYSILAVPAYTFVGVMLVAGGFFLAVGRHHASHKRMVEIITTIDPQELGSQKLTTDLLASLSLERSGWAGEDVDGEPDPRPEAGRLFRVLRWAFGFGSRSAAAAQAPKKSRTILRRLVTMPATTPAYIRRILVPNGALTTMYFLWPSIAQNVFSLFACDKYGGSIHVEGVDDCTEGSVDIPSKFLWESHLESECYRGKHLLYVLMLGLPGIVFTIGTIVITYILLRRNKEKLDNATTRLKYGFIYSSFEKQYYWFSTAGALTKLGLMASVAVFHQYGVMYQLFMCLLLLLTNLLLQTLIKPYYNVEVDLCSIRLLLASFGMTMFGALVHYDYTVTRYMSARTRELILGLTLAANALVLAQAIYVIAREYARQLQETYNTRTRDEVEDPVSPRTEDKESVKDVKPVTPQTEDKDLEGNILPAVRNGAHGYALETQAPPGAVPDSGPESAGDPPS